MLSQSGFPFLNQEGLSSFQDDTKFNTPVVQCAASHFTRWLIPHVEEEDARCAFASISDLNTTFHHQYLGIVGFRDVDARLDNRVLLALKSLSIFRVAFRHSQSCSDRESGDKDECQDCVSD